MWVTAYRSLIRCMASVHRRYYIEYNHLFSTFIFSDRSHFHMCTTEVFSFYMIWKWKRHDWLAWKSSNELKIKIQLPNICMDVCFYHKMMNVNVANGRLEGSINQPIVFFSPLLLLPFLFHFDPSSPFSEVQKKRAKECQFRGKCINRNCRHNIRFLFFFSLREDACTGNWSLCMIIIIVSDFSRQLQRKIIRFTMKPCIW